MMTRMSKKGYEIIDPQCNHCWGSLRLTYGREIWPNTSKSKPSIAKKIYWVCEPCEARVGCHPGSNHPLGYAANAETRNARGEVHRLLDALWKKQKNKPSPPMTRKEVYKYLSKKMGLPRIETHVAMFTIDFCREAWVILRDLSVEKGIRE